MATSEPPAVLVVEDDPSVRGLIAAALQDEGYHVLEARNGHDAIRVVNEHPKRAEWPCLVLLDLMLPDTDGIHVLEQLAAPHGRVPVIAMSASRGHLAAAQRVGADAVLPKPFDLDRLVDLVEAYRDQARRQTPDSRA